MATITTTVPDDAVGKIKRNAEIALKSLSSYVVVGVSALAAVWLGLTEAQQAAFITAHPILTPLAPYLAVIAWLAAKLAPQNLVLSADKEAERKALLAKIEMLEQALGFGPAAAPPVPAEPAPVTSTAMVQAQFAAALGDLWPVLRQNSPGKTDAEILAKVQAGGPKQIVVMP